MPLGTAGRGGGWQPEWERQLGKRELGSLPYKRVHLFGQYRRTDRLSCLLPTRIAIASQRLGAENRGMASALPSLLLAQRATTGQRGAGKG
eukprot:1917410-Rhodomonas_salina.1